MICPECRGTGSGEAVSVGRHCTKVAILACFRCEGKKEVPDAMIEWMEKGEALQTKRTLKGITLWQMAKALDMSPVTLGRMEIGLEDPSPLIVGWK